MSIATNWPPLPLAKVKEFIPWFLAETKEPSHAEEEGSCQPELPSQ